MTDLQSYLSNDYPGYKSFLEVVIEPIFQDNFEANTKLLGMPDMLVNRFENIINTSPDEQLKKRASENGLTSILCLGEISLINTESPIKVYDITVNDNKKLAKNRKEVQDLIRSVLGKNSGAFMIFHYTNKQWEWRFSYCWKGMSDEDSTNAKRYTYLLGRGQACKTAALRFKGLKDKNGNIKLEDITDAFSVEALSKEFFNKYKAQYGKFVGYVIGKKYDEKKQTWVEDSSLQPNQLFYELKEDEKRVRDYVKKLLGRIVFLHFLQKKGWLGANEEWKDGDSNFMFNLFDKASEAQKANFLDEILEPLFEDALDNGKRAGLLYDTKVEEIGTVRIPFLGGGLFEQDREDKAKSVFPASYFAELFDFFTQYNFTIDENDPDDAEVGVDPEMLGMIFENLLEDNKDKGAFYTPKEIVQYMCKESLIAYLQTLVLSHVEGDVEDEPTKIALRNFVQEHDAKVLGGKNSPLAQQVDEALKTVKICDPAIGSGAFPMGLLKELYLCRGTLESFSNGAQIKEDIIQQNIYGVDIEKGAVDIARLRFWLSLIVDADKPETLPNMDFKIMQGNSLLEQYKDVRLDDIYNNNGQLELAFDEETTARMLFKEHMFKYFREEDHEEKGKLLKDIDKAVKSLVKAKTLGNTEVCAAIDDLNLRDNQEFFLWHTWFSEVLSDEKDKKGKTIKKGGFDIIIGNPPYGVSIKGDYRQKVVGALGKVPDFEIYYYFIELAKKIVRNGGVLSYIIPNTWLFNTYARKYREDIFNYWEVREVLDCSNFKIFESADVRNTVFRFERTNKNGNTVGYRNTANATSFTQLIDEPFEQISKKEVLSMNQNWGLVFRLDKAKVTLVNKITKHGTPLEQFFPEISQGLIAYDKYRGQSPEIIKNRAYHYSEYHEGLKKMLWGEDVTRYAVNWNNKEWIDYCSGIANPRQPKFFIKKRLLVREITNPSIYAALTDEEYYNDPAIIIALDSGVYSIETALGVLNSKIATFYHFNHSPKATKGSFPKILVQDIKDFPLPKVATGTNETIVKYVNNILDAKKSHTNTTSLETQIDRLVYELYGLTNAEVKIIDPEAQVTGTDNDLFKA